MTQGPPADLKLQRTSRDPATVPALLEGWLARCLPEGADPTGHAAQRHRRERDVLGDARVRRDLDRGRRAAAGQYVARVAPAAEDLPVFASYALQDQYDAMRIVGERTAVPVPQVRWMEPTGDVLGTPFFLMDRVDGVVPPDVLPYNFGDNWLYDATARTSAGCRTHRSQVLAGLHAIPDAATTFAFLDPAHGTAATALARNLARTPRLVRVRRRRTSAAPRSSSAALAWLEANLPDRRPRRCCAGATPASATCSTATSSRSASSTGRWPRSARASSTCRGWSSPTGSSSRSPAMLELPGMPHFMRAEDVDGDVRRAHRRHSSATSTWYHVYNARPVVHRLHAHRRPADPLRRDREARRHRDAVPPQAADRAAARGGRAADRWSVRSTSTRSTRCRCRSPGPARSDRNFYDRCYFNAHDRTGDIFLITGLGYYPNLGIKDAFVLVRRGDEQTAVHLATRIDDDRLDQRVGGYRIEVDRAAAASCGSSARRPRASRSTSPGRARSPCSRSSRT